MQIPNERTLFKILEFTVLVLSILFFLFFGEKQEIERVISEIRHFVVGAYSSVCLRNF